MVESASNDVGMAEVLSKLHSRFESEQAAYAWYSSEPLPGFSGHTAKQLVDDGRAPEVLAFISAVDTGVHA